MKKIMNHADDFVKEMIEGVYLANKDKLEWIPEINTLYRKDILEGKVTIMQGSGSGHEPAHIMCVGKGMLDASCPGNVFAAPPMDYVYECTKKIASDAGVLHIINNYQGDRMAWDMGREMAEMDGIKVGVVVVNDDVSVEDSLFTVGRRGVAGNFFVIKCCGAASEKGASLEELEYLALGALRKAVIEGNVNEGSVMSGQIAGLIREELTCEQVMQKLVAEADALLSGGWMQA